MVYPEVKSWMSKRDLDTRCKHEVDSVLGMYATAQAGQDLCVLPRSLGDAASAQVGVSADLPEIETDLWMVTHSDLRKTARVRALMDALGASIAPQIEQQSRS
ncbi:LysR substrate-binding domain-containing protein [uncultured Litoreibacter sp.]|uniref:LysR substrate-binding domain-containing protein n=1 Tax=uncultured Litoreibacter sp. TaxID=1392394 RepID=UPI0034575BF7